VNAVRFKMESQQRLGGDKEHRQSQPTNEQM
jgi:hypothetical protein